MEMSFTTNPGPGSSVGPQIVAQNVTCGTDYANGTVEFTTDPTGQIDPDPTIFNLDANGDFVNGVINLAIPSEQFDLIMVCKKSNGDPGPSIRQGPYTPIDGDGDGNSDEDENIAPGGDGNGDGIRDALQSSVATKPNPMTGEYATLEVTGDCNVVNGYVIIRESELEVQDEEYTYPVGLNDFNLRCGTPGESATVKIYYDKVYNTADWKFKKYNTNGKIYADISSIVTYSTVNVNGRDVTVAQYDITDGGQYDMDGIANGVIIDPAGPAVSAEEDCPGTIGNTIWLDVNANGKQDKGEKGLKKIRVKLKDNKGKVIAKTRTNHNGHYKFEDLCKGKYKVVVKKEDVAQYIQTYDPDSKMDGKDTVHLRKGQNYTKGDFGYSNREFELAKTGGDLWVWLIIMLGLEGLYIIRKKVRWKN
jgi:5-hydroxyisourate hydrolase-like protein (transthyretin family)